MNKKNKNYSTVKIFRFSSILFTFIMLAISLQTLKTTYKLIGNTTDNHKICYYNFVVTSEVRTTIERNRNHYQYQSIERKTILKAMKINPFKNNSINFGRK